VYSNDIAIVLSIENLRVDLMRRIEKKPTATALSLSQAQERSVQILFDQPFFSHVFSNADILYQQVLLAYNYFPFSKLL